MKEDYVSFKLAILLEKKGFPQHTTTHTYFVGDDKQRGCVVGDFIGHPSEETDTHLIDAPTHQMILKWLREVHKIFITVFVSIDLNGTYHYFSIVEDKDVKRRNKPSTMYSTYYDAVEDTAKFCLTNLI